MNLNSRDVTAAKARRAAPVVSEFVTTADHGTCCLCSRKLRAGQKIRSTIAGSQVSHEHVTCPQANPGERFIQGSR